MKALFPASWLGFNQARQSGGLRLARNKPGLPIDGRIRTLDLPSQLVLPLLDYRRETLPARVRPGESVAAGQLLASGVIASASGRIVAIEPRPIIHPSGRSANCIILEPDSLNRGEYPRYEPLPTLTAERLADCGVVGLGGAAFSISEKFMAARATGNALHTLLINAVECEPQISCDEALMMCEADSIVQAIAGLIQATDCRHCVLAIENDKLVAIDAIRQALRDQSVELELSLLDPVYPAGAERLLIRRITGRTLAPGERPAHLGILSLNVASALAADRARQGYPLVSRVVTVSGQALPEPLNVRVRFGTPVSEVLRQCGYEASPDSHRIRANGPLSGYDLESLDAPVTAATNSLAIRQTQATPAASPCIRCGECERVCPEQLLPQQLYWYAQADDLAGTRRFGLDSCITCGCCDLVCPAVIPLTATFRHARDAQREQDHQETLALASQQRFQARELRLQQRAAAREERRRLAKTRLTAGSDPIADALARARKRRKPRSSTAAIDDTSTPVSEGNSASGIQQDASTTACKPPGEGHS